MKKQTTIQKQIINNALSNKYVKYAAWSIGTITLIYLSGFIMTIIANTVLSYKNMSNSFKK